MGAEAIVVRQFGDPDVMQRVAIEPHALGGRQARVRVRAAGVAFGDVLRRRGLVLGKQHLPFTPGYDIVGIVEELGSRVTGLEVGARVAALIIEGGYSELAAVEAALLVPVPASVSDAQAACLSLNYVSARQMLRMARLRRPGVVLVHGAGGGVGTALVELAQLEGHTVYGTASSGKHAALRALGAIPIDYRAHDFVQVIRDEASQGIDAVFDGVGGEQLPRSLQVLAPSGRLIAFGFSSALEQGLTAANATIAFVVRQCFKPWGPAARFYGIGMPLVSGRRAIHDDLNALLELAARGAIHPIIGERLPFSRVADAHRALETSAAVGKIVLEMPAAGA